MAALVTFAPSNRNWMLPGTTAVPRFRITICTVPAGGKFTEFFDGLAEAIQGPEEAALVLGTKSIQFNCRSPTSMSETSLRTSLAVNRSVRIPERLRV